MGHPLESINPCDNQKSGSDNHNGKWQNAAADAWKPRDVSSSAAATSAANASAEANPTFKVSNEQKLNVMNSNTVSDANTNSNSASAKGGDVKINSSSFTPPPAVGDSAGIYGSYTVTGKGGKPETQTLNLTTGVESLNLTFMAPTPLGSAGFGFANAHPEGDLKNRVEATTKVVVGGYASGLADRFDDPTLMKSAQDLTRQGVTELQEMDKKKEK
jgi:hypothetical protein